MYVHAKTADREGRVNDFYSHHKLPAFGEDNSN